VRTPALTALLAVLATLAVAAPASAVTLPPDFEDHPLVEGLYFPTGVAWAPSGRMYVIQKDGEVFTVAPGSDIPEPLLSIADDVNFYGDRGLLGVAVDSQFAAHHYLYLLYTHKRFGMGSQSGNPMNSQLLRVELNTDGDEVVDQQVILGTHADGPAACPPPSNDVDCIPSEGDTHSIGSVRSAPDGTLYVGSGDAAGWTSVDPLALRTYDEQSLAGKIMHIDRDGKGLQSHPFCRGDSDLDHVCTKLYAKGFRNPYRFKLRPQGGLTVGDVGWTEREELDLVGAGGRNYGWPCYEGIRHTNGYRELDACQAEYAKEANPTTRDVPPDVDYPHREEGDPDPPVPSGNTVLGGPTYEGSEYPQGYRGKVFGGDFSAQEIWMLQPQASGPPTLEAFGSDMGPIVEVDTSPDGNLVYSSLGDFSAVGGSIREISYSALNHSPTAHATAAPTEGSDVPLTVAFHSTGSTDPEGDALTYDWGFGDGGHSSEPDPEHAYQAAGRYTAKLTVTDGGGKHGTDKVVVQVGTPPTDLQIQAPSHYRDGEEVTLHASAVDDGPLSYSWQLNLRHLSHLHPFTHQTGPDAVFTTPTDHDADAYVDIRLTVTDSDGLVSTASTQLHPETTGLHLRSEPAGAPLEYAGHSVTAPLNGLAAIGFEGSTSAAQSFSRNGRSYLFQGWDNGGPRLQTFSVPDQGLTMTARYRDVTPPIIKPAPPPFLPPPDSNGPRLRFKKLDSRKGVLSGTTSDAAGVKRVYVALGRATRGKRCRWWATASGRLSSHAGSCSKPPWIRATLKGSAWTARLRRKHVPPGGYRVVFRAVDRLGNVSRGLSDGTRLSRVRVTGAG
jgi:glucose/arabinose dehydrogenase